MFVCLATLSNSKETGQIRSRGPQVANTFASNTIGHGQEESEYTLFSILSGRSVAHNRSVRQTGQLFLPIPSQGWNG